MRKILVNDGIENSGKLMLEQAGYTVDMNKVPQEELVNKLNEYDAICVRSATKVRKEQIDAAPNLKVIARGGVGLDNIDVEYAKSKGIAVVNTPAASSRSVAELAFAHIFALARFIHLANREMPEKGSSQFNELKKQFAAGIELEGKTIGIIGMGRIGQEAAKIAIGMGMDVVAYDPFVKSMNLQIGNKKHQMTVTIDGSSLEEVLASADFITLHVPGVSTPILGENEFSKMKKGAFVINAARGGVIDEDALLYALNSGHLAGAGLDVFVSEPNPRIDLLQHSKISLTPHTGASTAEAQEKVGGELASQIISILG
ncbi:MAG: D-2-hydroxyacid dehydrogenase [Saprospiraceae bacterium]